MTSSLSLDSYFLGKQSKTQGKKAPKQNLKQSSFLAGEEGFHWPHGVCLGHQGKLPNPENRLWGNLALSRAFPLLMNPSWLTMASMPFHFSLLFPLRQSLKIQFKCRLLWKTSLTLSLLYATQSLK